MDMEKSTDIIHLPGEYERMSEERQREEDDNKTYERPTKTHFGGLLKELSKQYDSMGDNGWSQAVPSRV